MTLKIPYNTSILPAGVRSRFVDNNNGLIMHILEAGFDKPGRPVILLLHGFPELAYSWRKVIPALADLLPFPGLEKPYLPPYLPPLPLPIPPIFKY